MCSAKAKITNHKCLILQDLRFRGVEDGPGQCVLLVLGPPAPPRRFVYKPFPQTHRPDGVQVKSSCDPSEPWMRDGRYVRPISARTLASGSTGSTNALERWVERPVRQALMISPNDSRVVRLTEGPDFSEQTSQVRLSGDPCAGRVSRRWALDATSFRRVLNTDGSHGAGVGRTR